MKSEIAAEFYKAMERLGAKPELLAIIGSYGDTLEDAEILSLLRGYNETGVYMHKDARLRLVVDNAR